MEANDSPVRLLAMSNKTYDFFRWVTQYFLPALGTLYFAVGTLWGLPEIDKVIGTIVAVEIFLGVILGLSKAQYKTSESNFDGVLHVSEKDGVDYWTFEVDSDLDELSSREQLTLQIQRKPQS